MLLGRALLTTSDAILVAAPQRERLRVSHVIVCNSHTSAVTVNLHHLRPVGGETSGVSNAIVYLMRVAANTTEVLEAGDNPFVVLMPEETINGLESVGGKVCVSFHGEREPSA